MDKITRTDIEVYINQHWPTIGHVKFMKIKLPALGNLSINEYLEKNKDEFCYNDVMGLLMKMK